MNRFVLPLAGFIVLAVVFAISLNRAPEKMVMRSALLDKPAPEFTLPDLLAPDGQVQSKDFRGQWVMLNVWGTWCVECRVEHPVLNDIARTGKVTIVGLNYKDEDDLARQWLVDLGNPYAAVPADREGRVAIDYGVYGAPETFLINPEGVIVHKIVGVVTPALWSDTLLPMIEGRP